MVMLVNSPVFSAFVLVASTVANWTGRAWKQWMELKARLFFEESPELVDPASGLQPVAG
jgi:hypothetical protein